MHTCKVLAHADSENDDPYSCEEHFNLHLNWFVSSAWTSAVSINKLAAAIAIYAASL